MKKLLLIIPSAIVLLVACNTEKKDTLNSDKNIVFTDTSLIRTANGSTDVAANNVQPEVVADKPATAPKVQVRTITKVVRVVEKQPTSKPIEKVTPPIIAETPTSTIPTNNSTQTSGTGTTNVGTGSGDVSTVPIEKKKNTGWSQAAKDATIGGVGGAVAGAVIGKGAKGAAIGGIIGAAGGYILGRKADKKSGRVEYTDTGIYKKQ